MGERDQERLRANIQQILFAAGRKQISPPQDVDEAIDILTKLSCAAFNFESLAKISQAGEENHDELFVKYFAAVFPYEFRSFFEAVKFKKEINRKKVGGIFKGQRWEVYVKRLLSIESPGYIVHKRELNQYSLDRSKLVKEENWKLLEKAKRVLVFTRRKALDFVENAVKFDLSMFKKKPIFLKFIDYTFTVFLKETVMRSVKDKVTLEEAANNRIREASIRSEDFSKVTGEKFLQGAFKLFKEQKGQFLDTLLNKPSKFLRFSLRKSGENRAVIYTEDQKDEEMLNILDSPEKLWIDLNPIIKNMFLEQFIVQKKLTKLARTERFVPVLFSKLENSIPNSKFAKFVASKAKVGSFDEPDSELKDHLKQMITELFKTWFFQVFSDNDNLRVPLTTVSRSRLEGVPSDL